MRVTFTTSFLRTYLLVSIVINSLNEKIQGFWVGKVFYKYIID